MRSDALTLRKGDIMETPRRDPTANTAIGNVMREQRRKRRRDATMEPTLYPCTNCGGTVATDTNYQLFQGDCLEVMKDIPDKSIERMMLYQNGHCCQ